MTPVQAYNLRMRLLVAGYVTFPVVGGKPATVLREAPTENYVRSWAQRYPDSETGILIEGQAVVVTLVPNKRERNRLHKLAQRRASGALPRGEWLKANNISQTEPWKQVGISRAAWYRRKRAAAGQTALPGPDMGRPIVRARMRARRESADDRLDKRPID